MDPNLIHLVGAIGAASDAAANAPTALDQITQALASLAAATVTAGIGYAVYWLRAKLHLNASDSAEAAIRTAASTAAGKLAASVPPSAATAVASNIATPVSSLFSTPQLQAAAAKVIADLPAEVRLTGYNTTDITDMILASLPQFLSVINPAIGVAASAVVGAIKAAEK